MTVGRERGRTVRAFLFVAGWFATFFGLSRYGVFLLPASWASQIRLEQYLLGVQLLTLALWLGALRRAFRLSTDEVGLDARFRFRPVTIALCLAPLVYVVSSYAGLWCAYSTLLEEIRQGGIARVNEGAGEFGRVLASAPLWLTLLWGALAAPIGEELLFRGAAFSVLTRSRPARVEPVLPPDSSGAPSLPAPTFVRPLRIFGLPLDRWRYFLRGDGFAWLVTTVAFGALHADLSGGQGILRLVSTTCVGAAAGAARVLGKSVGPAIALHVGSNLLSILAARPWLVSETFPRFYVVPTLALLFAGLGVVVAAIVAIATAPRAME